MSTRTRTLVLLTAALLLPGITGHAEAPRSAGVLATPAVQTASGAAETQFLAWLNVFNAGNRARYEAFLREQFPSRAARLDGDINFFEMTGGFDLRKVESVTATTGPAWSRSGRGSRSRGRSWRLSRSTSSDRAAR
jgi:hypothetical protein